MFNRKKKKTGIQTPEFISNVSMSPVKPPKPPTSGSNARKPNPNYVPPASVIVNCGHQPTYTSTQNPPDTLSSLLKTTSLQILPNDIGTVTYICPYETPCGWCTKWDKKCDKKIGCDDNKPQRGLRAQTGIFLEDTMSEDIVREILENMREYDAAIDRIEDVIKENSND